LTQKEGDLPNPIPDFQTAKRVYDIAYSINKRLYQILITAFSEKVDDLPESSGIAATSPGDQSSGNGSCRVEIEQRDIGRPTALRSVRPDQAHKASRRSTKGTYGRAVH
jgi:hypothetical protein